MQPDLMPLFSGVMPEIGAIGASGAAKRHSHPQARRGLQPLLHESRFSQKPDFIRADVPEHTCDAELFVACSKHLSDLAFLARATALALPVRRASSWPGFRCEQLVTNLIRDLFNCSIPGRASIPVIFVNLRSFYE